MIDTLVVWLQAFLGRRAFIVRQGIIIVAAMSSPIFIRSGLSLSLSLRRVPPFVNAWELCSVNGESVCAAGRPTRQFGLLE